MQALTSALGRGPPSVGKPRASAALALVLDVVSWGEQLSHSLSGRRNRPTPHGLLWCARSPGSAGAGLAPEGPRAREQRRRGGQTDHRPH